MASADTPQSTRARREARRRKILESGGDRLKRITDTFSGVPTEQPTTPPPASNATVVEAAAATSTDDYTDSRPESSIPAASTPPSFPLDHHLRQRLNQPVVQSPSVARTPLSDIPFRKFAPADDDGLDSPLTGANNMPMSFEDLLGGQVDEDSPLLGLQRRLFEAAQQQEAGSGPQVETSSEDQVIVDGSSAISYILNIMRVAMILFVAVLTWYTFSSDVEETHGSWDSDDAINDIPDGSLWIKRIADLSRKRVAAVGEISFGKFHLSIWALFVTLELGMVIMRFFATPSRKAAPGLTADILAAAGQFGFPSQRVEYLLKAVNNYRAIWGTVLDDLSMYVFIMGIAIAGAALCI
ncbi:hypothetical protein BC832DRAFT_618016 [Gaertneriomyces semiglobifer]|nr:hypothetical protein BC832DRAFT_618016 [Gaertneriomyces semiglobifer]